MNAPIAHRTRAPQSDLEVQFEAEIAEALARAPDPDRGSAQADFARLGLPTRRVEAWHYSDLRAGLKSLARTFSRPGVPTLADAAKRLAALERLAATRFVFVDGWFTESLSDTAPRNVIVRSASGGAGASPLSDAMMAATTALAADPMGLRVDAADTGVASVEIVHVSSGAVGTESARIELELTPGAHAVVVERFVGAAAGTLRLYRCDATLAEAASLVHLVTIEDSAGLHIESLSPRLAKGSHYAAFALVAGGDFVRRQIFARLEGEKARLGLSGLSLIDGCRHADTTLEVTHAAPRGESREFFKHIVADEGVGVYQGKVIVDPGAQKTDGVMKSQAVLLSPTAQMNNKPELEIFADDVVCGHGATVAALDGEQIFYLRARGIPRAEAEAMVLEAFGAEAILREVPEALQEPLLAAMHTWLAKRAGARPA